MRFLLSRRWLAGLALAVAFAVVCVSLGLWQWDRRTARHEANMIITANYGQQPAPPGQLLPSQGVDLPAGDEWRPVVATGRYLEDGTVLLRQRPLDGTNGFHVLVPLLLEGVEGSAPRALLVDRGFLPSGDEAGAVDVPPAPGGEVTAVVHLRPAEEAYGEAPEGQTRSIDPQGLAARAPTSAALAGAQLVDGAYGVLAQEQPTAGAAPQLLPAPPVDEGPHLSYAFQWWVFAAGGFVGYGVVARRHAADLREDAEADRDRDGGPPPDDSPDRVHDPVAGAAERTGPRSGRTPTGSRRRRAQAPRRRPTAEDEEDALVDAAERTRGGS
ncbi:SURF1 family protein [uncultured Pseudokineococcus sp.]|uniref:SURF1 family cytochrome oxidase biogenesis protein n=1 Tax=uncultured Pseudokineococcus sp. TaxID=1642928 RepID=UPI00262113DA|nr:SURF1 family cytochrome oxidase biogenesis protein [uncultured Pseudokineococcus sp.]